ncbi:unnamed protein product [Xylocopa violacea]|uniref:Reverse transcriptase domain-containing protein n=1 Tax=Xylocopa violacea TaxID=135666 RepID=A0ABP1PDH1_XYLVO
MIRSVHQESILQPLLWNLTFDQVLKGLMDPIRNCRVDCFADDTVILCRSDKITEAVDRCQAAVTKFVKIIEYLGLVVAETERGKNKNFQYFELKAKEHKITNKTGVKYLGILLDDKLHFGPHIRSTVPKTIKIMSMTVTSKMIVTVRLWAALFGAPIWSSAADSVMNGPVLEKIKCVCRVPLSMLCTHSTLRSHRRLYGDLSTQYNGKNAQKSVRGY